MSASGSAQVSDAPALVDLGPLSSLERAGGVSFLDTDALETLDLVNLKHVRVLSIGGGLPNLKSLETLSNLRSARAIDLIHLPNLRSLDGLQGVSSLEWLEIHGSGVTSLRGLSSLVEVSRSISLLDLPDLTSLAGLEQVTALRTLLIAACGSLAALAGLDNVTTIEEWVELQDNAALASAEGCSCPEFPTCSCTDFCMCSGNDNTQICE